MKGLLILITVLAGSFCAKAQDILKKQNGEEMLVKVEETNPDLIKYRTIENPNGPQLSIQTREVAEIKFQNGLVQKFTTTPQPAATEMRKPAGYRKNALAVNALPLIFRSFNVFYDQRLTDHPNVALSFGFGTWNQNFGFFSRANQEISLTGAAKFYLDGSDFYFSPYLKYRTVSSPENLRWHQMGAGGSIGNRHIFKSGFLIDSFLGLGVYAVNVSNREQTNEFYFTPSPIDIRLGLALGYAF